MSLELQTIWQTDSDKNAGLAISNADDPARLTWWASEYLRTRATGAASTLKYKRQDIAHFIGWFVWAM